MNRAKKLLVFGLALGSMVLAPISELYGRRPVYIVGMAITTLLIIPCGIGNSLQELIIVRFFGAFFGSAMIAISPGTISDIATAEYRALAFSVWAVGPLNGPTFGPIIGGFATQCVRSVLAGKVTRNADLAIGISVGGGAIGSC